MPGKWGRKSDEDKWTDLKKRIAELAGSPAAPPPSAVATSLRVALNKINDANTAENRVAAHIEVLILNVFSQFS